MQRILPLLTLVLLLNLPVQGADDELDIKVSPPTSTRRTFDPKKRPRDMPPLKPGEAAITQSNFRCQAAIRYTRTEGENHITITHVTLQTSLDSVIWLPRSAPRKLIDHEDAHRDIAQVVYQDARSTARRIAAPLIGRRIDITAMDPDTIADTVNALIRQTCDAWLDRIGGRSGAVNAAFDRITDHGRNPVDEKEAMRRAFEQVDART